jgi:hypothetical protein
MTSTFHWWQGIVAGGGGVLAMSVVMRMGMRMGMTSMDLPTVLGSMFRGDRTGAKTLGTILHFINGLVFGLVYSLIWWQLGIGHFTIASAWWIGLIFGAIHGVVVEVVMPMLGAMHPRAEQAPRTALAGAGSEVVALPQHFGFGGSGFGSGTPMGMFLAHLAFGGVWAIIFAALV